MGGGNSFAWLSPLGHEIRSCCKIVETIFFALLYESNAMPSQTGISKTLIDKHYTLMIIGNIPRFSSSEHESRHLLDCTQSMHLMLRTYTPLLAP